MHLYVYYQVPEGAAKELAPRVRAMQASLGRHASLMRRPVDAGPETWMEVYPQVDDTFEPLLQAAVATHDLASRTGPRRLERFEDFDACA